MVWPTGISSPSRALIPPRTPSPGASTSTTALSVSTSISGSPRWTSSPSSLSQRTSRPVSWDIPSAGMITCCGIASGPDAGEARLAPTAGHLALLAELAGQLRDPPGGGDGQVLQRRREGHRDVHCAEPLDGGVQV